MVVYNHNVPVSKTVAQYYAAKRKVPSSNLVGVFVPETEHMDRSTFEANMVPEIRLFVKRLKKAGKTPAILLVYGIPLRVEDKTGVNLNNLLPDVSNKKVKEYKDLVLQLIRQLDLLLDGNQSATRSNQKNATKALTTKSILDIANKSLRNALKYLSTTNSDRKERGTRIKVSSLVIRLAGMSIIAKNIMRRLSMASKEAIAILKKDNLLQWNAILEQQLMEMRFKGVLPKEAPKVAATIRIVNGLIGELKFWDDRQKNDLDQMTSASVDSELTLLLRNPYQLAKWLPNPYLKNFNHFPEIGQIREKTVMVGRLDGPTPDLARRLVDDAMAVEETGLTGTFYIDARGLKGEGSYSLYDKHLRNLYKIIKENSSMPVVLDNKPELFPQNTADNAALYAGWYSLGKYVDSFKWRKGAVGFHIASAEATTLKKPGSEVWCKRMIEEGVAATLGPVGEPYLFSFPLPELFFPLLMSGKFSLLEVYFQSTPFLSWRQILIGDPLYTPFKNNPAIDLQSILTKSGQG